MPVPVITIPTYIMPLVTSVTVSVVPAIAPVTTACPLYRDVAVASVPLAGSIPHCIFNAG